MREFLQFLRRNPIFWILPLVVFVATIALVVYVGTRPVLGTAIYQP